MQERIEYGLALAIAGQIAVGLAEGDGREARQQGALYAIGLMLLNATKHNEEAYRSVQEVLSAGEGATVTIDGGAITVTVEGGGVEYVDGEEVPTPSS